MSLVNLTENQQKPVRPGKWFAIVEIDADPNATAQEVRNEVVEFQSFVVQRDNPNFDSRILKSVKVKVDRQFGLHADQGSDENTICWP